MEAVGWISHGGGKQRAFYVDHYSSIRKCYYVELGGEEIAYHNSRGKTM